MVILCISSYSCVSDSSQRQPDGVPSGCAATVHGVRRRLLLGAQHAGHSIVGSNAGRVGPAVLSRNHRCDC